VNMQRPNNQQENLPIFSCNFCPFGTLRLDALGKHMLTGCLHPANMMVG
jgi:hypothetical protein